MARAISLREVLWHITMSEAGRGARAAGEVGWDCVAVQVRLLDRAVEHAERGNGGVLSLTCPGAEKLAELRAAWRTGQRHAHEPLGNEASEAIKQLVGPMFAEQRTG